MQAASAGISLTPLLQSGQLPKPPDPSRAAAAEFEQVFVSTFVQRLFESLSTDGPFGGGHAEATFRSFLADEYAGEIVRQGGIGIADDVQAELMRIQEAQP